MLSRNVTTDRKQLFCVFGFCVWALLLLQQQIERLDPKIFQIVQIETSPLTRDREECFSHSVPYEGDTVHVSFVVIKAETPWHYGDEGVDLVVKDPSGTQIHDFYDKTSEKFEFMAQKRGLHRFCFTNRSPYHETIDFDVYIGHFSYFEQHAKDEHFGPLLEQIGKLEEALYNIQFEQHWLEAQTDRQAIVNEGMSRRAIHKALFESAALIGASVLQVYLLRQLFERKLGRV
ncbi:Transmembrane emp24 domain-containing protein [Musa troglodytarum]|uniref:Transmembrane emp24 domain-containing protein n=1 Tax=Musa troglodytarum TaxID=320322 RepID=A0A9E7KG57_9LILI|nr:Transmembrane emp24 domain-containing protein [Musa troglodytarum]